jgi:hypothetical protein
MMPHKRGQEWGKAVAGVARVTKVARPLRGSLVLYVYFSLSKCVSVR